MNHQSAATTMLRPNLGVYNLNLPLITDHMSTTATNLGSRGARVVAVHKFDRVQRTVYCV